MGDKVITMKLKLDRKCEKCYKKVKKVLRKFPEIREQVFDERQNIITIKVVCSDPEKLMDKLCCKGCGCIRSIEMVGPDPPPPPPPPPDPAISNKINIEIGMCCSQMSHCHQSFSEDNIWCAIM